MGTNETSVGGVLLPSAWTTTMANPVMFTTDGSGRSTVPKPIPTVQTVVLVGATSDDDAEAAAGHQIIDICSDDHAVLTACLS